MAIKKEQNTPLYDQDYTEYDPYEGSDYGGEETYWDLVRRRNNTCVWDDDCYSCPYWSDCALWNRSY